MISNHGPELPTVCTPLPESDVVRTLAAAARRGKLAGFEEREPGCLFSAAAFGEVFDYRLLASSSRDDSTSTRLAFNLKILPKVPLILAVVLALTIWPGVWLTDSMLTTYFSWYTIPTWWWYLPMTVLPIPWMWKRMNAKSHAAAVAHANEQIDKIAAELGGKIQSNAKSDPRLV